MHGRFVIRRCEQTGPSEFFHFLLIFMDPKLNSMRCMIRGLGRPGSARVDASCLWSRNASDNAQNASGTSQDDGTPAENPSDASMATVHLRPRLTARPPVTRSVARPACSAGATVWRPRYARPGPDVAHAGADAVTAGRP